MFIIAISYSCKISKTHKTNWICINDKHFRSSDKFFWSNKRHTYVSNQKRFLGYFSVLRGKNLYMARKLEIHILSAFKESLTDRNIDLLVIMRKENFYIE